LPSPSIPPAAGSPSGLGWIFSLPADLAHHARAVLLHLPASAPWTNLVITGVTRLRALAVPG
jgi:hypothetical protein